MPKVLPFIDGKLENVHAFLHTTHNYIKWQAPLDVMEMNPQQTYKVSCEAMRITVRLTQVIAWFLLQKAVLEGELTREEFLSEDCRVLRGKHCLESASEFDPELPLRLRELLKESRTLYLRILRLDALAREQARRPKKPSLHRFDLL
jgi:regulator of CtrA degradation